MYILCIYTKYNKNIIEIYYTTEPFNVKHTQDRFFSDFF